MTNRENGIAVKWLQWEEEEVPWKYGVLIQVVMDIKGAPCGVVIENTPEGGRFRVVELSQMIYEGDNPVEYNQLPEQGPKEDFPANLVDSTVYQPLGPTEFDSYVAQTIRLLPGLQVPSMFQGKEAANGLSRVYSMVAELPPSARAAFEVNFENRLKKTRKIANAKWVAFAPGDIERNIVAEAEFALLWKGEPPTKIEDDSRDEEEDGIVEKLNRGEGL